MVVALVSLVHRPAHITWLACVVAVFFITTAQGDCGPQSCAPNGSCLADKCTCNSGFARPYCTEPIEAVQLNKEYTISKLGPTGHKWFKYTHSWTGTASTNRPTIVVSTYNLQGSNCNSVRMYLRADCGACTPPEHEFTSDIDSTPTEYHFASFVSGGRASTTIRGSTTRSACGCATTTTNSETWYVSVSNILGSTSVQSCQGTFRISDPCTGRGTYDSQSQTCTCNQGTAGDDCSGTMQSMSLNTQTPIVVPGGSSVYYQSKEEMFKTLGDNVTPVISILKTGGSCTSVQVKMSIDCTNNGACSNSGFTTQSVALSLASTRQEPSNTFTLARTSSVGCCAKSNSQAKAVISVTNSGTSSCQISIWVGDRCHKRGTYNTDAKLCLCQSGSAGDDCRYNVLSGTAGGTVASSIPSGAIRFLSLAPQAGADLNREIRFTLTSRGNCTSVLLYGKYVCDTAQCQPGFPSSASPSTGSDVRSTTTSSLPNVVFSTDRTQCGCSAVGATETWNLLIHNTNTDETTCGYDLNLSPYCANGGVKTGSICECSKLYAGTYCEYPVRVYPPGSHVLEGLTSNGDGSLYAFRFPATTTTTFSGTTKSADLVSLKFTLEDTSNTCGSIGMYVKPACYPETDSPSSTTASACLPRTTTATSSTGNYYGRLSSSTQTVTVPYDYQRTNSACGCPNPSNELWYIRVTGTSTCRPTLTLAAVDPCNNNGVLDTVTGDCTCVTGTGNACENSALPLAAGATAHSLADPATSGSPNNIHVLDLRSTDPGFARIKFTVSPASTASQALSLLQTNNCNAMTIKVWAICEQACSAASAPSNAVTDSGALPITIDVPFDVQQAQCGCQSSSQSPVWYLDVSYASFARSTGSCAYNVSLVKEVLCPAKDADAPPCNGNGACLPSSTCKCNEGFNGIDCSAKTSTQATEVFNLVPTTRTSLANEPILFFVPTAPTNSHLVVRVTPAAGIATDASGLKLAIYRRFGSPPVVPVTTSPAGFPKIITKVAGNVTADESLQLDAGQTFEFTDLKAGRIYFAVVAIDRLVDFYNPVPFEVDIEVELSDPVGTAVDAALLSLLAIIFIGLIVWAVRKSKESAEEQKMSIFERKRQENKEQLKRSTELQSIVVGNNTCTPPINDDEEQSVIKIQALYRGQKQRKQNKEQAAAAVTIQRAFRSHHPASPAGGTADNNSGGDGDGDDDDEASKKKKEKEEEEAKKGENMYTATALAEGGRAGVLIYDANQSDGVLQTGAGAVGAGGSNGGGGGASDLPELMPSGDGRMATAAKDSAGFGAMVAQFLISVCSLVFDVVRMLINMSLIYASLDTLLTAVAPDVTIVTPKAEVIDKLETVFGPFSNIVDEMSSLLGFIDLQSLLQDGWNCGGTLVIMVPFLLLILTVLLRVVLQRDLLLILAISIRSFKTGRNVIVKLVITAISKLFTVILLYAVQVLLVLNHSLISAIFTINTSCSRVDRLAFQYNRIAVFGCIAIMLLVNFYLFAGRTSLTAGKSNRAARFVAHVFGMIGGVFRILFLTFGYWNDTMVRAHSILYRAEKFDDDDEDDDNQHERVISITGASRGLIWMAIPFTIILAKLAEAVNSPPIFVSSNSVNFRRPRWMRFVLWIFHVLQLVMVVGLIFFADQMMVYLLALSFLPPFIIDLVDGLQNV